jgi:hypothetical protein
MPNNVAERTSAKVSKAVEFPSKEGPYNMVHLRTVLLVKREQNNARDI